MPRLIQFPKLWKPSVAFKLNSKPGSDTSESSEMETGAEEFSSTTVDSFRSEMIVVPTFDSLGSVGYDTVYSSAKTGNTSFAMGNIAQDYDAAASPGYDRIVYDNVNSSRGYDMILPALKIHHCTGSSCSPQLR